MRKATLSLLGACVVGVAAGQGVPPTGGEVTLSLTANASVFSESTPVVLNAMLKNSSAAPVGVAAAKLNEHHVQGRDYAVFPVTLWNAGGTVSRNGVTGTSVDTVLDELNPDREQTGFLLLNRIYDLKPGQYRVQLQTRLVGAAFNLVSNVYEFEVRRAARGDFNADGVIDVQDLAVIQSALNARAYHDVVDGRDLNGDGIISVADGRILTGLCTHPRCASR